MAEPSCTSPLSRRAILTAGIAAVASTALPAQAISGDAWRALDGQLSGCHPNMPAALARAQRAGVQPGSLTAVHLHGDGDPAGFPVLRFGPEADCILVSPSGAVKQRATVAALRFDAGDPHSALYADFERLTGEADAVWRQAKDAATAEDAERLDRLGDAIWHRRDAVEDAIIHTPAMTQEGIAVKARLLRAYQREGVDYPKINEALVEQVLAFLERT